ncbi:YqaJ viral recombinase family protein [Nocardia terpenica]|uniref:YqaJ viral recombinase domain-containing protein n=1 Tax=Nocardia terpenica TaxID=455432 RepID=A0A164PMS1_9NOCA|nr:YqaJ viral recombinase family protein [Nocardia terpenica]KZM75786.1 hypothetical protein AWN90_20840 [Nocardia terpenica]NQE86305.1 hypothetical protein [Nocardia terpenica]
MTTSPRIVMQPGSSDWRRRITASKIPGILNASKYSSPTKEFYLLRNAIDPDPDNEAMERGRDFEPVILDRFFRRYPELERVGAQTFSRTGIESWAAATPDDVAVHTDTTEIFCVEAKTDCYGDYQWGRPGTDEIPLGYYLQVQWQMHMADVARAYVVKLGPFFDEDEFIVEYDSTLAEKVESHCRAFYLNAMDPDGQPPEVDGHSATYDAIRRAHPEIDRTRRGQDWRVTRELAREFEDALAGVDAAEERLNLVKSKLLRVMGRARRAVVGTGKHTQVVATRQPTKTGVALYKMRRPIDWSLVVDDPTTPTHPDR